MEVGSQPGILQKFEPPILTDVSLGYKRAKFFCHLACAKINR